MTIQVTWDVEAVLVSDEIVRSAAERALAHGGRPGLDVDVILVGDPTLANLHERYLSDPAPTDVMAFDLGESGGGPAGEIYVSVDRARAVGAERGVDPARELVLYVVHGALHLCGLDDHREQDRLAMRAAERSVLEEIAPQDP